jgi:hypothetical protein
MYSGPSSFDRPDIQTTWVTTKILVLTYDQFLCYDPHAGQGHLSYDPHGVRKLQSEPRYACLWAQFWSVHCCIYLISLIAIKMAPKKLENDFLLITLGKLLVFLVNYAYYANLF